MQQSVSKRVMKSGALLPCSIAPNACAESHCPVESASQSGAGRHCGHALIGSFQAPRQSRNRLPACAQPAFVRVHQDFTRNVLRGGKPEIVKDVRFYLGRELSLEEFKYWTALVRTLRKCFHTHLITPCASLQLLTKWHIEWKAGTHLH